MSGAQQVLLVTLRTLIGWHFLYEGYFKLVTPGWGPDGLPLSAWSSVLMCPISLARAPCSSCSSPRWADRNWSR